MMSKAYATSVAGLLTAGREKIFNTASARRAASISRAVRRAYVSAHSANERASSLPVLSTGSIGGKRETSTEHDVGEVAYVRHVKKGATDAPPTLRVDYFAPDTGSTSSVPKKIASEWICVEHAG